MESNLWWAANLAPQLQPSDDLAWLWSAPPTSSLVGSLGPWSPRHRSGLAHDVHVVSGPVGCEVMVFTLDPWMRP